MAEYTKLDSGIAILKGCAASGGGGGSDGVCSSENYGSILLNGFVSAGDIALVLLEAAAIGIALIIAAVAIQFIRRTVRSA